MNIQELLSYKDYKDGLKALYDAFDLIKEFSLTG